MSDGKEGHSQDAKTMRSLPGCGRGQHRLSVHHLLSVSHSAAVPGAHPKRRVGDPAASSRGMLKAFSRHVAGASRGDSM